MLNVESFVYGYFDEVKIYGNPPTDYNVDCPFCQDGKFHMNISMSKQVVHCWKCGYSGSWIKLVMDVTRQNYHQALGELYDQPKAKDFQRVLGGYMGVKDGIVNTIPDRCLPKDFRSLAGCTDGEAIPFHTYLRKRGVMENDWIRYNLGFAPKTVPGRVIIPIEREYWQGRAIHNWMEPKYLNPKTPARDMLFNPAALERYEEVVICEGAFSAMAVGANAVALIGKQPTQEKVVRLLASQVRSFIIALEPFAFGTMQIVADALHRDGRIVTIWKYDRGDPADPDGSFTEIQYNFKSKMQLLLGKS